MRSLRERLMAVSSSAPQAAKKPPPPPREDPFFCREHVVPLSALGGIEETTLDEVRACDPLFSGTSWDARDLLFLDTETTGLSGGAGTLAFEVGVGFLEERGMVIRQYVMRDYGEEGAMLSELAGLLERYTTVVSFNGKSFDLPLLESRMVMNRLRVRVCDRPHLDLLHTARRVYRLRLRRCNLASLEEAVLGQTREDDLPGAQVPQRYFDYLKTGEFALLEDVLRHNFQDVVSLAQLTAHLCAVYRQPERLAHEEDLYSVGRTLLRGGRIQQGRACMRIIGCGSLGAQARMHLADSYRHEREWSEAVAVWQAMIASGEGGAQPYLSLAKYYEHVERDTRRALACARGALTCAINTASITGSEAQMDAIYKRIQRLQRRLAAETERKRST